jgi:hypothetical protein
VLIESKEVTYIRLKRIAALDSTNRACRQWGIGARNNGTGRPEDGHEQDGEDSGDAVEHHLVEKIIKEYEVVASSSRLREATAEEHWPFMKAFYTFLTSRFDL